MERPTGVNMADDQMVVTRLSWDQVASFRLRQHGLIDPDDDDPVGVAARIAGVHAQVMSSAELAIGLRTASTRRRIVSEYLWDRKALLKLWAMRGTLHLLPSAEIGFWSTALTSGREHMQERWARWHGITTDDMRAVVEAIRVSLQGAALTREELIAEVSQFVKHDRLTMHLLSGWGSMLKPASYMGYLCFGPNRGRNVTFTSPESVCGSFDRPSKDEALAEITRRHLRAYGPTSHARFAVWFGARATTAKQMFGEVASALASVDVEGVKAYVLASDLYDLQNAPPVDSVLLLGGFDPYTVALCTSGQLRLPDPILKSRISRTAGWISPVLLINGRIAGVWSHELRRGRVTVQVEPFVKITQRTRKLAARNAQRIGEFLDARVELEIGSG